MKNCIKYKSGDFNIQGLTRLNEDACYKRVNSKTIQKSGKYMVSNFHNCDCEAPVTKNLSLQHPAVQYRDGHGWTSINGCNVDNDSKLRNANNLTNKRCIQQLQERPYKTIPYMGRGRGNICQETKLQPGEDTFQNRPCNNLAGVYIDRFIPQIPCIRNTIQNAKHLIPEDNDRTWLRGGQPSRQVIRNKEYLNRCGFKYNGKYWNKK